MNRKWIGWVFVMILGMGTDGFAQSVKFITPIGGTYLKDYFIVNYIDNDATTGIRDPYCGSKTYDGHMGEDFVIRSYRQMDSLVPVYAAAKGKVFITKDSMYDRNNAANLLGLGNYIGINHKDTLYSYYGHLKKYSLKVKAGDSVLAGQIIAYVGGSGNALSPHLHFEVWTKSNLVDPFQGPCGSKLSLWQSGQLAYDTALRMIASGFVPYKPSYDSLQERISPRKDFVTPVDSIIAYWSLLSGLHKGDTLRTFWFKPNGSLWFSYHYGITRDEWYYYHWTWINAPEVFFSDGNPWKCKLYVNNKLIDSKTFSIYPVDGIQVAVHSLAITRILKTGRGWTVILPEESTISALQYQAYDLMGRKIDVKCMQNGNNLQVEALPNTPELFILRISDGIHSASLKLMR